GRPLRTGAVRRRGWEAMSRNIAGWALIALGLAGIVGGLGMAYVVWVTNDTAARDAAAQDGMSHAAPPRQSEAALRYGAAALSAVVGLVLVFWGAGFRGSGERKRGKKDRSRRDCPNCGEMSPKTARNCFHCGHPF